MKKIENGLEGGLKSVHFVAAMVTAVLHLAPIIDDVEGTNRILAAYQLEPIKVGGGVWISGGLGDMLKTKFMARQQTGEKKCVAGFTTRGFFSTPGMVIRDLKIAPCPEIDSGMP